MTLARALRLAGRNEDAARLDAQAATVRDDFQRLLLVDGVLAGYALFDGNDDAGQRIRYLLHPRDATTGVRYSVARDDPRDPRGHADPGAGAARTWR